MVAIVAASPDRRPEVDARVVMRIDFESDA
jgi:hypothetical protein